MNLQSGYNRHPTAREVGSVGSQVVMINGVSRTVGDDSNCWISAPLSDGEAVLTLKLPSPALPHTLDFSFSGIKTAALNYLNSAAQKDEPVNRADVAASYTAKIVEAIVKQTGAALDSTTTDNGETPAGIDVNGDGKIDAEDDVNNDGNIDEEDVEEFNAEA